MPNIKHNVEVRQLYQFVFVKLWQVQASQTIKIY